MPTPLLSPEDQDLAIWRKFSFQEWCICRGGGLGFVRNFCWKILYRKIQVLQSIFEYVLRTKDVWYKSGGESLCHASKLNQKLQLSKPILLHCSSVYSSVSNTNLTKLKSIENRMHKIVPKKNQQEKSNHELQQTIPILDIMHNEWYQCVFMIKIKSDRQHT